MKNKGFSLVELIVVIAIMAILVGIAVPVYTGYIGKAQKSKDIQMVDEVAHALQIYGIANGGTGYVVLYQGDTAAVANGAVGTAMDEIFGDGWESELSLSYDGWTDDGLLALAISQGESAALVPDSSFLTGNTVEGLLGEVADLTSSALDFLTRKAPNMNPDIYFNSVQGMLTSSPEDFATLCQKYGIETNVDEDGNTVFADDVSEAQLANLIVIAASKDLAGFKNGTIVAPTSASGLVLRYATIVAAANSPYATADTKTAYAKLNETFKTVSSVEEVEKAMENFEQDQGYINYTNDDTGVTESDGYAFLNIMEAVDSVSGKIDADQMSNPNLYNDAFVSNAFSTYVSAAGVVSSLSQAELEVLKNVPAGSVVVFLNADGSTTVTPANVLG